ncbi:MAG: hypothetical protein A2046_10675 [Bacteroidetes bacterium GWA2_30_7]|nr:MAG: hypothetical protein A2046_10675 [Bacteroidetes bacterium GWA2_30_7]
MKFTLILILFINILYTSIFSQTKKSIKALYTTENIKVDGFLNEVIWNKAEKSSDFIQFEPLNGAKASEKTDVMILYDNSAVYIGAMLYDKSKDSIYKELGKRDNAEVNSDLFMVGINPYNDGLNVVGFMVTAAGVQIDIKYNNDNEDFSWNAVWFSNIQILDSGWSVEMKIPFSALRFPKKTVQEWGFNALRQVRRNRELSSWNFVDKKMNSVTKQYGIITGIENIKPPLRLSATPYMSYYLQHNEQQQLNYRINGGLDVKYGINESFTLDMTLIPDFGQVKSDDKILNLTPFETFYGENRPFFTEGTELFNKGNIFYSRRIGGEPLNYNTVNENLAQGEKIKFNPAETKMINATKFSGRTKNGLGLGFFNAMTNKTDAIIIDSVGNEFKVETQPFTNYNMIVLDQSLRNNSYVSIINT